ncbi:MAG: hypothetical protein ACEPOZ_12510 [Marinifilaceae bacterium]|jgi:hypothetical protein
MKNLNKFLSSLDDTELSIFIAYRFEDFLDRSRNKISAEVKRRKLNKSDLKKLLEKGLPANTQNPFACPQYNSSRFSIETDYELRQKNYGSYEVAVETNRCQLCGFNPGKSTQKELVEKLKQIFGFYKKEHLKKPEIDGRLFT